MQTGPGLRLLAQRLQTKPAPGGYFKGAEDPALLWQVSQDIADRRQTTTHPHLQVGM